MTDCVGATDLPDISGGGILGTVNEPAESVGDRIRIAREALSLSQVTLAAAMRARGFSTQQSAVSEWEGAVVPDARHLVGLAQALDQSTDYLLGIGSPRGKLAEKLSQKSGEKKIAQGTKVPVTQPDKGVGYRRSPTSPGVDDAHLSASRSEQQKLSPEKAIQAARRFLDIALNNLSADAKDRQPTSVGTRRNTRRRRPRK